MTGTIHRRQTIGLAILFAYRILLPAALLVAVGVWVFVAATGRA